MLAKFRILRILIYLHIIQDLSRMPGYFVFQRFLNREVHKRLKYHKIKESLLNETKKKSSLRKKT